MTPLPVDAARRWRLVYQSLDQSDDIVVVVQQVPGEADSPLVVAVNEAFHRATGYTDGEMFGQPLMKLASPEATAAVRAAIAAAVEKRQSLRTELPCLSRSGEQFWLGLHLMPPTEEGSDHFVLLGRDITEALQDAPAAGSDPGPAGQSVPLCRCRRRHRR